MVKITRLHDPAHWMVECSEHTEHVLVCKTRQEARDEKRAHEFIYHDMKVTDPATGQVVHPSELRKRHSRGHWANVRYAPTESGYCALGALYKSI